MAAPLAAVPVPPAAAAADPVVSAAGAAEAETATAPAALADDAPQPDEPASEKDVDDATKPAAELVESVPEPVVPAAAAPATEAAAPAAVDEESAPSATETAAVPTPVEEPAAPAAPTEEKAVGEPSNALTAQFTDAEKSTLKEFRTLLPEIFATAYPDKADAKTAPITLWGVAKTSVVLMKFLRARNLNVAEAKTMLTNTLKWRQEFGIEAALKEEYPKDVFGSLGYISGKDKQGRPVVYNVYGGNKDMNAVFSDVQRFLRWRVAFMEKSLDLLDFETVDQAVQVHDYAGVSMSSRTPQSKQAASEASKIFGDHYPELLYKKYFVNVPTLMSFIFWTFKAILPAKTFAKMSVVGTSTNSIRDTLKDVIDVKEIPKRYGGEAEGF
ncbi:CRAL-TRIO domain-containing protein [Schizophyllum amplum]|uniref:Phosphatidylinositol transfer protein SFH5 n=1 Tax=Schizophyllum amplum TaxID=97359 RepID=A0A550CL16_9AGAR|nr:CRAL-TRIO domain-containing protein [Auriculariopsis ampla]